jgi:hypothetical protein
MVSRVTAALVAAAGAAGVLARYGVGRATLHVLGRDFAS